MPTWKCRQVTNCPTTRQNPTHIGPTACLLSKVCLSALCGDHCRFVHICASCSLIWRHTLRHGSAHTHPHTTLLNVMQSLTSDAPSRSSMTSPALDDPNFPLSVNGGGGGGGTGASSHTAAGVSHLVRSGAFQVDRLEGIMGKRGEGRGRDVFHCLLVLMHHMFTSPLPFSLLPSLPPLSSSLGLQAQPRSAEINQERGFRRPPSQQWRQQWRNECKGRGV